MYSINIFLKIFTFIILSVITFFMEGYYLFWVLFFYLLLLTIFDRNFKALLLDFLIVSILLFCRFNDKSELILKFLFIILLVILFIFSISKNDIRIFNYKWKYRFNKRGRKRLFYDRYLDDIKDENYRRASSIYNNYNLEKKIKNDIENKYLYAKIRFYGYSDNISYVNSLKFKWKWIDTLFLLIEVVLFILMYYFR